ncbi:MAG: hypothetical protein Pg6A_13160 [Termitinemataceae bacterium]|nr:MAG: hypothetical protein Pg6A_13160 [Termitinemataceae bacterium]
MEIESRDPVQELIPDEQKRGAFWNDFYSILRKQGIDPIEDTAGRGMAVEELEQVHAKELAFEGSMDATEGFSRDIAELFVKYSDKNLQMRDGQVINPAVYKNELKQESPEKTEAVERSPEQNAQARGNTPEERAFLTAVHQRKVIAEALKSGSLSCLPGADGYADTAPAVNIANGTRYHGANLLQLKEHQKQNGFPSAEYVTKDALEKSGVPLKPKQNGIDISFGVKNEETGKRENKFITLYNIGQSQNPEQLKAWGAAQIEEKIQDKMDYLKQRYGNAPQPHERKEGQSAPEISPKSAEPEKYLGAYLAAVSMGGKFKPSSEQAAEFSKNFEASLFQKGQNGHTDPFKLSKICNAASEHCKEVIKEVRQGQRREQTQQQKIEHTKSRGRSL